MRQVYWFVVMFVLQTTVTATTIHVPTDQPTIQAGIDAAMDGDTVLIADGTYIGTGNKNLSFNGKAITVQSENGAETCIIDCENDGRGVFFSGGEDRTTILSGLTIAHGNMGTGTGTAIQCWYSSPTISGCVFVYHQPYWGGAILVAYESSPAIENCDISQTSSARAIYIADSEVEMVDCMITNNDAGGVVVSDSSLIMTNCTILQNYVGAGCMGAGVDAYSSQLTVKDCEVSNNHAHSGGGGISADHSQVLIEKCNISNNTAFSGYGGGLKSNFSNGVITNCDFSHNEATGSGGAISLACRKPDNFVVENCNIVSNIGGGGGGGVYVSGSGCLIDSCLISNNQAQGWELFGGGICCMSADLVMESCIITENTAINGGGGVAFYHSAAQLRNSLVSYNSAGIGDGLYFHSYYNPEKVPLVENCTIFRHDSAAYVEYCSPIFRNCIVWDSSVPISEGEGSFLIVEYSDIEGSWPGVGNIDEDPQFVGGNYLSQIAAGQSLDSPCLDAGSVLSQEICLNDGCLSEHTTRTDQVSDSGIVDMGYHSRPSTTAPQVPSLNMIGIIALLLIIGAIIIAKR